MTLAQGDVQLIGFAHVSYYALTPATVEVIDSAIFTTVNPGKEHGYTAQDMVKINVVSLFNPNTTFDKYILARTPLPGKRGTVTVNVYAYDQSNPAVRGSLIFSLSGSTISNGFEKIGTPRLVKSAFLKGDVLSDNIKALAQDAFPQLGNPGVCNVSTPDINSFNMALVSTGTKKVDLEYTANTIYQCGRGKNYENEQPVIVEVIAYNIEIGTIQIPGLAGAFNLNDYFNPEAKFELHIAVNGVEKTVQQWRKQGNEVPTIDLKMGDDVAFKVVDNTSSTVSSSYRPKVTGIPAVWVAPFAGDLMFYCSPSVTPGEFNPWIGMDTRVHTLMLRKYPPDFQVNVPDWDKVSSSPRAFLWNWTAQRHMDASKDKYTAAYTWIKYKVLKDKSLQRNNQKEGLNLTFLSFWNNWLTSNYKNYDGHIQYMMGFDEDELMYLNDQDRFAEGNSNPWGPGGGILKLERLPWQKMPEGYDQLYNPVTGNPAEGFPLNILIDAYRNNREAVVNNNPNYNSQYAGYEIQDIGTDEEHPDGTGTGNDAAPGLVTIHSLCCRFLKVKFNVSSPLTSDNGFYGSLLGTTWPSFSEGNVPYTLTGLKGLPLSELDKYSMSYSIMDRVGNVSEQTVYLKNVPDEQKRKIILTGEWTSLWNLDRPSYSWMTAYYQRTPSSAKVIIAGKELKQIFLLMYNEKGAEPDQVNLKQAGGGGYKVWLNDFRQEPEGVYDTPWKFGNKTLYTYPYYREYVIHPGNTLRYEVLDGDPYTFMNPYTEYYLGSRSMAKRVPYDSLDGRVNGKQVADPFLKAYVKRSNSSTWVPIPAGFDSLYFTFQPVSLGSYDLKVMYRNTSEMTHHIRVLNYSGSHVGRTAMRELTDKERQFLGITTGLFWVFTTDNLYSQYTYVDGPRTNDPPNRWAEYNDYEGLYNFYIYNPDNNMQVLMHQAPVIKDWISNYDKNKRLKWFWPDWANHYSSNWATVNPNTGLQGLPKYVQSKFVTRIYLPGGEIDPWNSYMQQHFFTNRKDFSWQYVVPLISYTDYQGYRMRTNPSCIYQISQVFDNRIGAFSGNPDNPVDVNSIQAPDISDDFKDQQDLYYGLISGQIMILGPADLASAFNEIKWDPVSHKGFNTKVRNCIDLKEISQREFAWPPVNK
jgi:hypothetical protein